MVSVLYYMRCHGRHVELRDGVDVVVGRDPSCDLPIDDLSASRRHCRIKRDGPVVHVIDLGSRNGVQVNGNAVVGGRATLHHADVLIVGGTHLSLVVQTLPVTDASALPKVVEAEALGPTHEPASSLQVFAQGAADALAQRDLLVAEMSVKNLLRALRSLARRGRTIDPRLALRAAELTLDLAEVSRDRAWIEELDIFVETLGLTVPPATRQRRHTLDARM